MRQEKLSNIYPANVGPTAGAKIIASPTVPIAVPRFSGGNNDNTTFINNGIMIPVDAAWISLPISNTANVGAIADTIVPARKIIMAAKYNCLVEKRFIKNPVTGINTPLTSI